MSMLHTYIPSHVGYWKYIHNIKCVEFYVKMIYFQIMEIKMNHYILLQRLVFHSLFIVEGMSTEEEKYI